MGRGRGLETSGTTRLRSKKKQETLIFEISINDVSPETEQSLIQLTLTPDDPEPFGMWDMYLTAKKYETESYVFTAEIDKNIVGWCLLRYEEYGRRIPEIDIFIEEKYRRKGIGKDLIQKATEKSGKTFKSKPTAIGHDELSCLFYNSFDSLRVTDSRK